MNRSNTGANKDTAHIVKDVLLLLAAYAVAVLTMGKEWDLRTFVGMSGLVAVFTLIYLLENGEQYLYNVTLFGYPDRILRRRTRSFLLAAAVTVVLLSFITEDPKGYFLFVMLVDGLEIRKLLQNRGRQVGRVRE